ncbi:ArsR/SmtB family transcription factor [Lederbergia lenta]|uniref:ArsR/SmtB family transcription factor n=1 Tax=Lederbergia lenta TaxID=1467 RepID=UPI00203C6AFD|nr:helix-turn-helix domain-containing protein [Lederbergia lenta]
MRTLQLTLHEAIEITKALSNEHRMEILNQLTGGPKNVNDLSELLAIPFSTAAAHIKKLEETDLIKTEIVPGRGNQKVSSKRYDRIIIDLEEKEPIMEDEITFELNIGEYVHCQVEPTCGLLSEKGIIHILDDPRSFFEPERKNAQLIWFRSGHIEYHFPNRIPYGTEVEELSFSVELCSEAPYHNLDWPSDITCLINDHEIGDWTSPGDFGGERGFLTPSWWETHNTQYGLLKYWNINKEGSFIDGMKISSVTIDELQLQDHPYISLKLGIKKEANNLGGINIFGTKFGNYEQGLIMKVKYAHV